MRVVARRIDHVVVLGFDSGEMLDCHVASDVRSQAIRLLDSRSDVVVDLSHLEFVDSAGLGVLVSLYRRVTGRVPEPRPPLQRGTAELTGTPRARIPRHGRSHRLREQGAQDRRTQGHVAAGTSHDRSVSTSPTG